MTDLVPIGLKIVTEGVDTATQKLGAYKQEASGANKASGELAGGTKRASDAVLKLLQSMDATLKVIAQAQAAQQGLANATGATASAIQQEVAAVQQQAAAVERASTANISFSGSFTQVITSAGMADKALENVIGSAGASAAALDRAGDQAQAAALDYAHFYDVAQRDFSTQWVAAGHRSIGVSDALEKSNRVLQRTTLNLTRQFSDVGVSLASGMPIWMVAIQQGSQVQDAFAQAKLEGLSFKEAMSGIVAGAGRLAVVLAPVAIAVGALVTAFAVGTREINQHMGKVTDGLNLTEEQLKRVKHTSVTMGDTMKAVFEVSGRYLNSEFSEEISAIQRVLSQVYNGIISYTVNTVKFIGGAFLGAYEGIKAVWKLLPGAIGDMAIQAANAVINAVEGMVNKSIDTINRLRPALNMAAKMSGVALEIPELGHVKLDPIANQFAGQGEEAAAAFMKGFNKGASAAWKGVDQFLGDVMREAFANAQEIALDEAGKARKKAKEASDKHADSLKRELAAMAATTGANYALADAYLVSDAAAMRAAAAADAIGRAIKRKGDIAAFVDAQLALSASEQAVASAKQIADAQFETRALERLNAAVAAGTITREQANQQLALEVALRPLVATMQNEEGDRLRTLQELMFGVIEATNSLNDTKKGGADSDALTEMIVQQERAAELIGKTAVEQARLNAEWAVADLHLDATNIRLKTMADWYVVLAEAATKDPLGDLVKELSLIDDIVRDAASGMEQAFGRVGGAIGGLTEALSGYQLQLKQIQQEEDAGTLKAEEAALRRRAVEIQTYGDMASAAKGFFKENSTGYKALQAVEMAYRLWQFAASVQAMAQQGAETATVVAASSARGSAKAAEGAAGIFAALGPFGFPVVAAMVAVLAGLGLKGLGSGGRSASVPTSEDRQKAQGAGSILGDSAAKSDSISKSLELANSNWNDLLEFQNKQLDALRAIEANIGTLAAGLARELRVGGAFDTSGMGLGKDRDGPGALQKFLNPISAILPGLFGSTTNRTLNDQGLEFVAQTVGGIIADGVVGSTYAEIIEQTKKKLFGLTISNKSSVETISGALGGDLASQIQAIIGSLRGGVLAAASILGVEGAAATLDAFTVDLGKLSFKDMTGAEIEDELNAIFGRLGDDMAAAALPFLAELQKVGEGAFETLTRVARQYTVLDTSLESVGLTFGAVGVASLAARERLIDLAGGIDALADQIDFYGKNFLTDAERIAPVQKAVNAELERLGLVGLTTRDQFKHVVDGLDLTTEAGSAMFAALMKLAPAFDAVIKYTEGLTLDLTDLAKASAQFISGLLEASGIAAQPTWQQQAMAGRLDRLDRERRASQTALEAAQAAEAAWAETLAALKTGLPGQLRSGDVAGAMASQMRINPAEPTYYRPDGSINVAALNASVAVAQAKAAKELTRMVSLNALATEDAGAVLAELRRFVGDRTYSILGIVERRNVMASIGQMVGEGMSPVISTALTDVVETIAMNNLRQRYATDAPGLGQVRAAREQLDYVSEVGSYGIGKDANAYNYARSRLMGELEAGEITFGTYTRALEGLDKEVGEKAVRAALDASAALERVAYYTEELREAGLRSISQAFGQIATQADALAKAAEEAGDPLAELTGTIGRMTSLATVLGESVDAATYGGSSLDDRNVRTADLIARAAGIAAQVLTTEQAKALAEELAKNPVFSGLSGTGLRDVALLLDGIGAFDPAGLETAVTRLNDALIKGIITQEQYVALFNTGLDSFEGLQGATDEAAQAAADMAKRFEDAVKGLKDFRDALKVGDQSSLTVGGRLSEAQRQFDRALGLARGGDADAAGSLQGLAGTLLNLGQSGLGSQASYNALLGEVLADFATIQMPDDPSLDLAQEGNDLVRAQTEEIKSLRLDMANLLSAVEKGTSETASGVRQIAEDGVRILNPVTA